MSTKPTKREALDANIGRHDEVDDHPLISCAPHILNGHAHLKNRQVRVERVLGGVLRERKPGPLAIGRLKNGTALTVTDEEVRASLRYVIDVVDNLSHLYAELDRLKRSYEDMGRHAKAVTP